MSAAVTSLTFDKPAYFKGDTITATVEYSADLEFNATAQAVAIAGTPGTLQGVITVHGVALLQDDGNHTWTKVSDDGATAVFQATA